MINTYKVGQFFLYAKFKMIVVSELLSIDSVRFKMLIKLNESWLFSDRFQKSAVTQFGIKTSSINDTIQVTGV